MENSTRLFEQATRKKLRFEYKGVIDVEKLWDLSLEDLNSLYVSILENIKAPSQLIKPLMEDKKETERVKTEQLKAEIVSYIFVVKSTEYEASLKAAEQAKTKQYIMELISSKDKEDLSSKSKEELMDMINQF